MGVAAMALRRHANAYMADPLYRIAWLAFPLSAAAILIAHLLQPAPDILNVPADQGPWAHRSNVPPQLAILEGLFRKAMQSDLAAENQLRQEASRGSALAQTLMGNLYDPNLNKGSASEARTREAIEWYRKAALQDYVIAESNLGVMLAHDRFGIQADYAEARRWLDKVAPLNVAAERELALIHRDGRGGPVDPAGAAAMLRDAAERGDVAAENLLGDAYDQGGALVAADPSEAVRMFRLAAMQNDATAQRKLAEHLEGGKGVPRDPADASAWFARAAAGGDATAQTAVARADPTAPFKIPKWGATKQTVEMPAGDDAKAERGRCLAFRLRDRPDQTAFDLPASFEDQKARSDDLILKAPRDPRVRYARAAFLYDGDRADVAKVDLECAIDDRTTWYRFPAVQPYILALLARIDVDKGDPATAKRVMAPVCSAKTVAVRALDDNLGLCGVGASVQDAVRKP
jgi:TPR repeat protein